MPQKRIPLQSGKMYHVWTHANGDENLFREDENYRYFLEKYTYHVYPVVETFAYCLMPNHLHLMIRVREEEELLTLPGFGTLEGLEISKEVSRKFSHLFNGYTQAYNKRYDRKGSLFIPNFRRKNIDSDQYFSRLMVYIHNNPVHHGFVDSPGEWPHSSWHAYMFDKDSKVEKEEGLEMLGGRPVFEKLHQKLQSWAIISGYED